MAVTALETRVLPRRALVGAGVVGLVCLAAATLRGPAGTGGTWLLGTAAVVAIFAAGMHVLSRTQGWPEASTMVFIFLIYTNVLVIASQFHGVPVSVLSFSYLLLALPLAAYAFSRREPIVLTRAFPFLVLYLGALCLSGAFAQNVGATTRPIWGFVNEGLVMYVLVANTVRTPATLRRVLWVLIAAAALLSALTLWQEVTGSYGNTLGGLTQTNVEDLKVGEDFEGVKVLRDRLAGPLGSPNRYAQILAMVVPLALLRTTGERRGLLRAVAAGAALLALAGILLTFSRGTVVALAGVLVVMFALKAFRVRHVVLSVVAFVAVIGLAAPDYLNRLESLRGIEGLAVEGGEAPDGALRGRATSNLAALNVFLDNPVVGVGPLQYFQQYSLTEGNEVGIRYRDSRRRAHNLYFEMAADTGILGLAAFLAITVVTMRELRRLSRYWRSRRPDLANLADSLFFALLAYFATATFLQLSYQRYLWMFMGLAGAGTWVLRPEAVERAADAARSSRVTDPTDGPHADRTPVAALPQ